MKTYPKILLLSAAAVSPFAYSAGFQISETSASGMGRANAGEAARIDNAAAIAKNPAAMSYFEKQSISITGHYIAPSIDVEGTNSGVDPVLSSAYSNNADKKDIAPSAIVPGAYYILPINDQWAFGVALNSRFGLSTDFESGYAASEHAHESSIMSIYITPSVSYKLNDAITFGLGVSYITGEGELKTTASDSVASSTGCTASAPTCLQPESTLLDLEADGDGFGWNIGMMWQINEDARIGFSYMSAVDLDTDADYKKLNGTTGVIESKSGVLTFSLPDVAEVAYTQKVGDKWDVSASIQYTGWSAFKELAVDSEPKPLKEENWDNAMRYSIGADYAINEDVTIRFGYAFDESPVGDENRTLSIPDADRNWFSVGGTFALPVGSIDAGLSYIKGKSVSVNEEFESAAGATLTTFDGKLSKTDAMIYSLGYNISF